MPNILTNASRDMEVGAAKKAKQQDAAGGRSEPEQEKSVKFAIRKLPDRPLGLKQGG